MYFEDDSKQLNKNALLLAKERYNKRIAPFVKGSFERLTYVDPMIDEIIDDVVKNGADRDYVSTQLRTVIADGLSAPELATSKPQKIKLPFDQKGQKDPKEKGYGGGPPAPPLKYDPAKVNPSPDASTDLSYHQGPVLEEELREPDKVFDLGDETTDYDGKGLGKGSKEEDFKSKFACPECGETYDSAIDAGKGKGTSLVCVKCGSTLEKKSKTSNCTCEGCDDPDCECTDCDGEGCGCGKKESSVKCARCDMNCQGMVCPNCTEHLLKLAYGDMQMLPGQGIQTQPGMGMTGNCPNCGLPYTNNMGQPSCMCNANPGQNAENDMSQANYFNAVPPAVRPQNTGAVKEALMPDDPVMAPQPNAPGQMPPPQPQQPEQFMPEKPIKVDQGLSDSPRQRFDDVVSSLANKAAAMQFSQASNEEIDMIAQNYGLDPSQVKDGLVVVSNFGDEKAVNGVIGATEPDLQTLTEVNMEGMGGRVGAHEAQVPLQLAIQKVAEDLGTDSNAIYTSLKDSFGNQDLPNQYIAAISGDHRFYLPSNLIGMQPNEPAQPEPQSQFNQTPDDTHSPLQAQPAH